MTRDIHRTRWDVVAVAVACGIVAGIQVGKVPPSLSVLREDLGIGLVTAGWIASTFNLIAAVVGLGGGVIADRVGARPVMLWGMVLLAAGAGVGALADGAGALLGARVFAGIGFVAVVVAAPRLVVNSTVASARPLALGIWSIYMPAGMAIGMLAAPSLLAAHGWRGLWVADALLTLAVVPVAAWLTRGLDGAAAPPAPLRDLARTATRAGPWLLAACFACYTMQFFAVMAWLPTYLMETQGASVAAAAAFSALAVGANVIGNLAGAWCLHRGVARWWLQIAALVTMGACAVGVFSDLAGPAAKVPLAFAFSAVGGLLPAAVLAGSARHAPGPGQVATVNGIVIQGANAGSLAGPPLFAALVAWQGGWSGTWGALVAFGIAGIAVSLVLRAVELRMGSRPPGP